MEDLLLIGGGASGLSLGLLLESPILEASPYAGGHATSTMHHGYTFDRGPHIMFSRSQFLLDCMVKSLGSNVHTCTRNNKVYVSGRLAKYPIENDLAAFAPAVAAELLTSYVTSQMQQSPVQEHENLAEWFTAHFGEAMTSLYFRPYNEKVWKTKLEELSMTWSERIPKPPVADVIRGAVGVPTEGYLHQLHYQYPKTGGYSSLMNAWARGIPSHKMSLNSPVTRIRRVNGHLEVETHSSIVTSREVVSTIPLRDLVEIFVGTPPAIKDAVRRLKTNATIIVTLGLRGIDPNQWTAVYIPDPEFLPNRLSWPAVFSPENAPAGCFSVQAEIICRTLGDLSHLTDRQICDHVVDGIHKRGLLTDEAEVEHEFVERYELAYVVYTQGYEMDLAEVKTWFQSQGVHIHGRFGSHNYLNVDGCLAESIALAARLDRPRSEQEIGDLFKDLGREHAQ